MSSNAPILAEEKQKYVSAVGLSFSLTFNVSSFGAGTSVDIQLQTASWE